MSMPTLDLPAEMPRSVGDAGDAVREPQEVVRELRLAAALFLYEHGRISGGRAAELAGISRSEFISLCGRAGIDTVRYGPEELESDYAALGGGSQRSE